MRNPNLSSKNSSIKDEVNNFTKVELENQSFSS